MRCKKCGTPKIWRFDHDTGKDIQICPHCDLNPKDDKDENDEDDTYTLKK